MDKSIKLQYRIKWTLPLTLSAARERPYSCVLRVTKQTARVRVMWNDPYTGWEVGVSSASTAPSSDTPSVVSLTSLVPWLTSSILSSNLSLADSQEVSGRPSQAREVTATRDERMAWYSLHCFSHRANTEASISPLARGTAKGRVHLINYLVGQFINLDPTHPHSL